MGVEGEKRAMGMERVRMRKIVGGGAAFSLGGRASRGKWANQTRTQPVNATGPLYYPSESLRAFASPCEPLRALTKPGKSQVPTAPIS